MTLANILGFAALALIIRLASKDSWRGWVLFAASILAIFWLQPLTPIRSLDFWFPAATLALVALCWMLSTPAEARNWRANLPALLVLAGMALAVSLTRYLNFDAGIVTASRPPQVERVLLGLVIVAVVGLGLARLGRNVLVLPAAMIVVLVGLFIFIKTPALAALASAWLRSLVGQSAALASATDLRWLGFSYVAFRLIHTLRDRQTGRLPLVSLQEYVVYVIFFPAFTAGPIDRLERFIKDLRRPLTCEPEASALRLEDFGAAGQRLLLGAFKKFVLADSLALIALNATNAGQVASAGWTWVLVYAYTLQIFFDFSGYTDIAIGLGRLLGIRLPENFNAPYLKPNLTQFWNNWHMTLTQWFRAYFFNPLTRALRRAQRPVPITLVILITQLSTMALIGLWHGVTFNFLIWGAWHGLGLFLQNRWSELVRGPSAALQSRPLLKNISAVAGGLLTFHYVALGWVWFALPSPEMSLQVLERLVGR
jgi:alginate O-acetyltransferase complex protein AlgI